MRRVAPVIDLGQEILRHLDQAITACKLGVLQRGEPRAGTVAIGEAFRHLHSAKAIALLDESSDLPRLLHEAENAAGLLRRRDEPELAGRVGQFASLLHKVRSAVETGRVGSATKHAKQFIANLERDAQSPPLDVPRDLAARLALDEDALGALTEYERHRLLSNLRARVPLVEVRVRFAQTDFASRIEEVRNRFMAVGEVIGMLPSIETSHLGMISFRILLASRESDESLALLVTPALVAVRSLTRTSFPLPGQDAGPRPAADAIAEETGLLLSRLSTREKLQQASALLALHLGASKLRVERSLRSRGKARMRIFARIGKLQKQVARLKGTTASDCARLATASVRQCARELPRKLRISIAGSRVWLSRRVSDALSVALVHIVRNAVAHGADSTSRKPLHIRISFSSRARTIEAQVSDDGKGISTSGVRAACERAGVSLPQRIEPREILDYVFDDRVTLAVTPDFAAGRGVGLAAVRRLVEELGGSVRILSSSSRGTTVRLCLPNDGETISTVVCEWQRRQIAFPLVQIAAVLAVPNDLPHAKLSGESFRYRGRQIHLAGSAKTASSAAPSGSWQPRTVLLSRGERHDAIAVRILRVERAARILPAGGKRRLLPAQIGILRLHHRPEIPLLDFEWLIQSNPNRAKRARVK